MEYCLRVYKKDREILVAVCDPDILGKTFEEGDLVIEVKENFYGNNRVEKEKVINALRYATIANITGINSVNCAIEAGIIDRERVLWIAGIPHAQMVRI